MKKWFTLTVAVAVLAFTGCSGDTGKKKETEVSAGDKKLKVSVPAEASVVAGKTTDVTVTISRTKFDDPVTVKFSDLPEGVSVKDGDSQTVEKGEKDKKFTLKADEKAAEVKNHVVKVAASAKPEGADKIEITESFKLTVTKK